MAMMAMTSPRGAALARPIIASVAMKGARATPDQKISAEGRPKSAWVRSAPATIARAAAALIAASARRTLRRKVLRAVIGVLLCQFDGANMAIRRNAGDYVRGNGSARGVRLS